MLTGQSGEALQGDDGMVTERWEEEFLTRAVWAKGIASGKVPRGEVGGRSSGRVGSGLGPALSKEVRNWDFFPGASAIGG